MATSKTRINITAEPEVEAALKMAARREKVPVATKAAELLALALEIEEDVYFAALAERRKKESKGKWISHNEVWAHLKLSTAKKSKKI